MSLEKKMIGNNISDNKKRTKKKDYLIVPDTRWNSNIIIPVSTAKFLGPILLIHWYLEWCVNASFAYSVDIHLF